jgi:hypothetical protein
MRKNTLLKEKGWRIKRLFVDPKIWEGLGCQILRDLTMHYVYVGLGSNGLT